MNVKGKFKQRPGIARIRGKAFVVPLWVEVPLETKLADLSYVMAELVLSDWKPPKKKKRKSWEREATAARKMLANVSDQIELGGAWGKVRKPTRE